jgi:hypothetical protein
MTIPKRPLDQLPIGEMFKELLNSQWQRILEPFHSFNFFGPAEDDSTDTTRKPTLLGRPPDVKSAVTVWYESLPVTDKQLPALKLAQIYKSIPENPGGVDRVRTIIGKLQPKEALPKSVD